MANAPNTTTSDFGAPLLHPGWDRAQAFELRTRPLFRRYVTKRVVDPTNRARVYYMPVHRYHDVAEDRHEVDEVVASDQVEAPDSYYVRIRIKEHGFAVGRTTLLNVTSYIPVDPVLAAQGSAHMADTLDEMVADVLYDGDQTRNDGSEDGDSTESFDQVVAPNTDGSADFDYDHESDRSTLVGDSGQDSSHNLTSRVTARVVARLRAAAAVPWTGMDYLGIMHPDTVVDYQEDTGTLGWQEPHKRVDTSLIYEGSVGRYRGVEWIEHPRARVVEEAGSSNADVYQTLIFGREVLAEHVVREPGFGLSPKLDTYNRHQTIYWYGILGHAIFRQEPLWRIEHTIS